MILNYSILSFVKANENSQIGYWNMSASSKALRFLMLTYLYENL